MGSPELRTADPQKGQLGPAEDTRFVPAPLLAYSVKGKRRGRSTDWRGTVGSPTLPWQNKPQLNIHQLLTTVVSKAIPEAHTVPA